jgi:EthD domain
MHKLLVLYPKGQDEKKFRPYYERQHASLVAKLPGLKASRYSFAIGGAPGADVPTASSRRSLPTRPRWELLCNRRKDRLSSPTLRTT